MKKEVKKKKNTKKSKKEDDSKLFAFLAVFLSIFGFIIALLVKREDKYVMFYAKQSLILFIAGIIARILSYMLAITIIGAIAVPFLWISYVILWIIALVNSLSGKEKETPVIGQYAKKVDL